MVANGSTIQIGFDYSHNGSSDSFGVSDLTLNGDAVPEPSTALLGAFGALMLLRRRR